MDIGMNISVIILEDARKMKIDIFDNNGNIIEINFTIDTGVDILDIALKECYSELQKGFKKLENNSNIIETNSIKKKSHCFKVQKDNNKFNILNNNIKKIISKFEFD